jgi:hypothetical protein
MGQALWPSRLGARVLGLGGGQFGPTQTLVAALAPSLAATLGGFEEGKGAPPPHYIKGGPGGEEHSF